MRRKNFARLLLCLLVSFVVTACGAGPDADSISGEQLAGLIVRGDAPLILDVRTQPEFDAGHIPGAMNIPHTELATRLAELGADRNREIVVHCKSGRRAMLAEETLRTSGFANLRRLQGDMDGWQADGRPVETSESLAP
jgi:rhodanese-related sulfurtransferase